MTRGVSDLFKWAWTADAPRLHCWMYRAAVAGALIRIATGGRAEVIFEIRHGLGGRIKLARRAMVVLVGLLSRLLRIRCTFNSHAAMANHLRFGYSKALCDVRWNLGRGLSRSFAAGAALRARLGIPAAAYVICSVGRDAPEKNFDAAVAAFKAINRDNQFVYLLAGSGCSRFNDPPTVRGVEQLERIEEAYSTADLVFIPSCVESLSNVLCEAIDCGCNIASTRAGDAVAYARARGYKTIEFDDSSTQALKHLLERAVSRFAPTIGAVAERPKCKEDDFK